MDATDTPVVVCDAGPLIHLDELDALDVLRDFQHIDVDGIFKTDGFVDARRFTPEAVAIMIKERVELLNLARQA